MKNKFSLKTNQNYYGSNGVDILFYCTGDVVQDKN